ncbi:MAG: ABC transporter substrate-binding protein [Clostridiales bacterium]|nr:ABC transporter substrate-binding protein [Clostridiales bacterium]
MKKICALLIATLLLASFAACKGGGTKAPPAPEGRTVTDMTGRTVTLPEQVERIVVLTAGDCEILYALGAGDRIVGRGEYCDYPADVLDVPSVQSGYDTNVEQIVALKPDVVVMSTMAQTNEHIESIEKVGIPVVVTEAPNLGGVYEAIALLGQVVGKTSEADALIQSMKDAFAALKAKVPQLDKKPAVYFEVSPLQYGLWAAGSGTFMDELGNMLGAENIFADLTGWVQVSEEQVIQRNPDFIVTTTMSYEGSPDPIEEIKSRAGWENITAVASGRILNADNDEITRPGPRLADAARQLFELLYGGAD